MARWILGVDIGGSGVKAAPVDVTTGRLKGRRERIETPQPPTPDAVIDVVAELATRWGWQGPVGVGYPGVVTHGVTRTAANLDPAWLGFDVAAALADRLSAPVTMVNDADAAGLAEVKFGAGAGVRGMVVMITFGTGIGSGVFVDGRLVPNTEFGHLGVDGQDAETRAAAVVRERENLTWKQWGKRADRYLEVVEDLLWPDLIVVGGGVSANFDKFAKYLQRRTPVVPSSSGNDAGIIGAALARAAAMRRST